MKSLSERRSLWLDCLISAAGFCGSVVAWNLWFIDGGWHREQHLGEVVLWAVSVLIGIWTAVSVMLRRHGVISPVTVVAAVFCVLNALSCLLFLLFLSMLLHGGQPR
jgi:hypothetical protein